MYIHDTKNEVDNRLQNFKSGQKKNESTKDLINDLLKMLDENNKLVKAFRMARDKFQSATITKLKLQLKSARKREGRQYNAPTCNEVATLIIDDIGINDSSRDIVIEH